MKVLLKVLIVTMTILGASHAYAATYYVDYVGGNDANTGVWNGTAKPTAWQHAPGDANATGIPLATILKAGDRVIFKGGVAYLGTVVMPWSGSAGRPIIYDGNTNFEENPFGYGRAIIDGENIRQKGFTGSNISYVTIDGFEVRNLYWNSSDAQNTRAVDFRKSSTGVVVNGAFIHNIGIWLNLPTTDKNQIGGLGVSFETGINNIVSNSEFTKVAIGIHIEGGDGCIFEGNNIHHFLVWGIDITSDRGQTQNMVVRNNTIHDMYQYDAPYWQGTPAEGPHTDYVFIRNPGNAGPAGYPKNVIVEQNRFYDDIDHSAVVRDGTAHVYISGNIDGTIVRNNSFLNYHPYYAVRSAYGATHTSVSNNTFYTGAGGRAFMTNGAGAVSFSNNIVVGDGAADIEEPGEAVFNNNLYCNVGKANAFVLDPSPRTGYSFTAWQAAGKDAGSTYFTDCSRIKFKDIAGFPVRSFLMDVSLQSTSPAIDQGTDLSSGFTNDINGIARSQGAGWDIGAYEYFQSWHYIRSSAPAGGDGSDWVHAWTTLPVTFIRGGTYYVADGDYPENFTLNTPESGQAMITIQKATVANHGTDIGWDNDFGDGVATFNDLSNMASSIYHALMWVRTGYWDINGVTGGGPGDWQRGHGFVFTTPACTPIDYIRILSGVGHIKASHIYFNQVGNTEICTTGASAFTDKGFLNNSLLEYNYFDNLGGLPFGLRYGARDIIQYNYSGNICGVSVADINDHCEALVMWGLSDLHFRWNFIAESPSSGGFVKNAPPVSDSVRIYGNYFQKGGSILCNDATSACSNWRIFNNTFANGAYGPMTGDGKISGALVYNNIIFNSPAIKLWMTHDNNWWSQSQVTCTMNPQAHENVINRHPGNCDLLNEVSDPFVHSAGSTPEDFQLKSAIATVQGIDVCSLDPCLGENKYDMDAFGRVRGADKAWDVGAYEYDARGDVSGDGRVTMYDAALVLKYTIGGTFTPAQQAQADINGDTAVDVTDAGIIARKALGLN